MRNNWICAAFSAALAASSCGNTPIDVAGRSYNVQSAEMMQVLGMPIVYLTDVPDFCSRMRTIYTSAGGCNAAPSSSNPYETIYGSFFSIGTFGASDGARLNIIPANATSSIYASSGGSSVSFSSVGTSTLSLRAVAGSVTVDQFRSGDHIAGTYDVTLEDGEREQGHFAAKYCNAMELVYTAAQNTRSCSESNDSSSYVRTCSCGQKTATVSCSPNSTSTSWSCSCYGGGSSSTCTMSHAPTAGSDTGTCCSLQL